jgi:hypothetical protein
MDGTLSKSAAYVLVGLAILIFLVVGLGYMRQRRVLNLSLKRLDNGVLEYELSDETVSISAPYGSWSIKWDFYNGLLITDEFTLMTYEQGGYSTLPSQCLPEEALDDLIVKIRKQGGRVKDRRSGR